MLENDARKYCHFSQTQWLNHCVFIIKKKCIVEAMQFLKIE